MPKSIFASKTNHRLQIFFVGHQAKRYAEDWPSAQQDIVKITGEWRQSTMLTVLADTDKDLGHGTLRIFTPQSAVHADGVIYHSDEPVALMFQTTDYPFLVVQDDITGKIAMGHCSKYAMKAGVNKPASCNEMVSTVLSHFKEVDRINLSAYITASICGRCYGHEPDVSPTTKLDRHLDHEDDRIRGELNLLRRIKRELRFEGIPEVNIEIDGRCTRNSPELSSHRMGHSHTNTIVVLVN